ncbi:NUDIX hydrolase [uncultured Salinisphaera sp.]|uniref:NUDIX hydrolase n=1 Tax=uncultured Salinisphaera sp. TaxID=359372 RepID=UPI0032B29C04|tara:strand:+ start:7901 stop:8500 length:600 start_codon:yes stop_codon:yes gene_type:complete
MSRQKRFCPNCGAPVEYRIPEGDDRKRRVCTATGEIFYDNPRNVVGTIIENDGAILLCRRAIEPRLGFWTLPAGFLELGETAAEGAARETWEESGIVAADLALQSMIDVTHIGQVHIFFTARQDGVQRPAGPESSEVAFVPIADIEWTQLAFPTIHRALTRYVADREAGRHGVHVEALAAHDWKAMNLDDRPRGRSPGW